MSEAPQRAPQRTPQRPPQRRHIYTGENRFNVDRSRIPPESAYAWKRVTIGGMEDTENQVMCEMNGWTPVPASRHPELMGTRVAPDAPIIRGGQMLMEQPKEWEKESRSIDEFAARQTLEEQVQRYGLAAKKSGARGISRSRDVIAELIE
jgi:hypothetical protein